MKDRILRAMLMDGQVAVQVARTTQLTEEARRAHHASALATAVLGRTLTMTAMMAMGLKHESHSVTVSFSSEDGVIGKVVAVGREGGLVKGYVEDPSLELPLNEKGKLDVGWAVGRNGRLSVVRDLGLSNPYVGQTSLVSGEIAEDFAYYFTVSEQTPSLVALGVLVGTEKVESAGGLLVQPMPGCGEEIIGQLEKKAESMGDISARFAGETSAEDLLEELFGDMKPVILETEEPRYACDCSRERMSRALIAMGEAELCDMLDEQGEAQVHCYFCNQTHVFSGQDIRQLIQEAKAG
jgi:molecular chaperone Hsp33